MSEQTPERHEPWDELRRLVEAQDTEALASFFRDLPPGEAARVLARLGETVGERTLATMSPETAAEVIETIPDVQAAQLIEGLEPAAAAAILSELPKHEQADLLGDLQPNGVEAILAELSPEEAREARDLTRYADDTAGGLMIREYLAYPQQATVGEVREDFRTHAERYRRFDVQYGYVTDDYGRLVGVLRLRDLLLAREERRLGELMVGEPLTVRDTATLDELRAVFEGRQFYGVPVVDAGGRLVGVVRRGAVQRALADRSGSDYLKSQGIVGGEELRTMPVLLRSRRRLAWLSINIVLNVIAASVIAFYQETLAAVIALAVFLPIISDMSGCSGNQAVAVSMRELSLGFVKPREVRLVWLKEISVGAINGLALGALIAAVAWMWKGNPFLGLVVGLAMAVNTLVAVSIGGTVPLLLRRMGMDPALASGPVLTTITDMCGFFLLLSLAAAMMPLLLS